MERKHKAKARLKLRRRQQGVHHGLLSIGDTLFPLAVPRTECLSAPERLTLKA